MQAAAAFGLVAGLLVLAVSVLGGASLPAGGLRAVGATALFAITGLVLQRIWQSLVAASSAQAQRGNAGAPTPEVVRQAGAPAVAQAATGGGPAGQSPAGAFLDQVLPAASPAELFEPLSPPVITARGMEE